MAGKIIIDTERCKGCSLCVLFCPKGCIAISKHSNRKGYFPAKLINDDCTGCTNCALVCSETAIKVLRDANITEIKQIGTGSRQNIPEGSSRSR